MSGEVIAGGGGGGVIIGGVVSVHCDVLATVHGYHDERASDRVEKCGVIVDKKCVSEGVTLSEESKMWRFLSS